MRLVSAEYSFGSINTMNINKTCLPIGLLCMCSNVYIIWVFFSTQQYKHFTEEKPLTEKHSTQGEQSAQEKQSTQGEQSVRKNHLIINTSPSINTTKKEYLSWKKVFSNSHLDCLYVLSAFYDDFYTKPTVRVISYGKFPTRKHVIMSRFIFNNSDTSNSSQCKTKYLKRRQMIYLLSCEVNSTEIPEFVKIQYSNKGEVQIPISYAGKDSCLPKKEISINVFAKILHDNYNNTNQLLEFIEYYRIQGVDHFTFYNESCSPQVSKLLHYYEDLGIVTIVSQGLPKDIDPIYTEYVTINDVAYRSRGRYSHIIGIDLDEYILPKNHKDMISFVKSLDIRNTSGYKISRYEFHKNFPINDTAQNLLEQFINKETSIKLDTQLYTQRIDGTCEQRGKLISMPCFVNVLAIHEVETSLPGYKYVLLPHKENTYIYHYRIYRKSDLHFLQPCPPTNRSTNDTEMHRFMDSLSHGMLYTYAQSGVNLSAT